MVPSLQHQVKHRLRGAIPDISYYGADATSDAERSEYLEWYETQRTEIFNNRRVLEEYCQVDVNVLSRRVKSSDVNIYRLGSWKCSWNL
jgi:hypothetical protein